MVRGRKRGLAEVCGISNPWLCGDSLMKAMVPVKRAHSNGRMAASWEGGRADASKGPEAAERGPQAASRSLMVLLGDTPCSRSSWLPPTCTPTRTACQWRGWGGRYPAYGNGGPYPACGNGGAYQE